MNDKYNDKSLAIANHATSSDSNNRIQPDNGHRQQNYEHQIISDISMIGEKDGRDLSATSSSTSRNNTVSSEHTHGNRSRANSGLFSPSKHAASSKSALTPTRSTWQCERCTFANEMRDRSCWMCGYKIGRNTTASSNSSIGAGSNVEIGRKIIWTTSETTESTISSVQVENIESTSPHNSMMQSVINMRDDAFFEVTASDIIKASSVPSTLILNSKDEGDSSSMKFERDNLKLIDEDSKKFSSNDKKRRRHSKPSQSQSLVDAEGGSLTSMLQVVAGQCSEVDECPLMVPDQSVKCATDHSDVSIEIKREVILTESEVTAPDCHILEEQPKVIFKDGFWECPQCTVMNSEKNRYCSICTYYNRELVKIKQLKRKSIGGEAPTINTSPLLPEIKKQNSSRQSNEGNTKKIKKNKTVLDEKPFESLDSHAALSDAPSSLKEEREQEVKDEHDLLAEIRAEEEANRSLKENPKPTIQEDIAIKDISKAKLEQMAQVIDPKDISTTDRQWECPCCTFMNPLSFRHCDVCTYHLPFQLKPPAPTTLSTPSSEVNQIQFKSPSESLPQRTNKFHGTKRPRIVSSNLHPRKRTISIMSSLRDEIGGGDEEMDQLIETTAHRPQRKVRTVGKNDAFGSTVLENGTNSSAVIENPMKASDKLFKTGLNASHNGSSRRRSNGRKISSTTNFANLGVKIDPNGPTDMAFKQMLYSKIFESPPPTKRGMAIIWGCAKCGRDNLMRDVECSECNSPQVAAFRYVALCTFHKALDSRRNKMKGEGGEECEPVAEELKARKRVGEGSSGGRSRNAASGRNGVRRKKLGQTTVSSAARQSRSRPGGSVNKVHLTASGHALDEDMVELLQDFHGRRRVGRRYVELDGEIETSLQGNSYRPPKIGSDCQVDLDMMPRVEDYYERSSMSRRSSTKNTVAHNPENNIYYDILWQPAPGMIQLFEEWEQTFADSAIDIGITLKDTPSRELASAWYTIPQEVNALVNEMLHQLEQKNLCNGDINNGTVVTTCESLETQPIGVHIPCAVPLIDDGVVKTIDDITDLRSFLKFYKHKNVEVTALHHLYRLNMNIPAAITAVEEHISKLGKLPNMVEDYPDNDPNSASLVDYDLVGKAIVLTLVDRVEQICHGRIFDQLDDDYLLNYEAYDMPIIPVPKMKPHYRKTVDLSLVDLDAVDRSRLFNCIIQYGGENWNRVVVSLS